MLRFHHRHRLRRREIENIATELANVLGCEVFSKDDTVDMAEGRDFDIVFVNGHILAFVIDKRPFLTIRGLLEYKPLKRFVTVDMGAIPFVCNGADIMSPGIVDADNTIEEGDMVWIRDEKNMKPLGVGVALISGGEMIKEGKGKAVRNMHYVGDKLWNVEE